LQDTIYSLWQTDSLPQHFRVFAGEQRAIGERMIATTSRRPKCIGYATFLDLLDKAPDPLIDALRQDVREISDHFGEVRPRLIALQNALIDLLKFLDPEYIRFARERRTKVSAEEALIGSGDVRGPTDESRGLAPDRQPASPAASAG
jgi:hypothetical protein